jgi:hypothetical protein
MRLAFRSVLLLSCLSLVVALAACASGGGSASGEGSSAAKAEAKAAAKPPKGVAPPASSKLAKVSVGMKPEQVKEILGDPTSQATYMTGKMWIPFYFGPTHQTDWKYKGQGRVVFVNNRWSGAVQSVTRIDYDPAEDGN